MGETFELPPLLETIERAGREALDCDRAAVFLYDPKTDELVSTIATGAAEIRFSARLGIAGDAAHSRQIIHVPDAYADPRFNPDIDLKTGYRTRNLLAFPLVVPDGELIGVLEVLNKLQGHFTPEDERLAAALGSLTAIAIKRQRLLDDAAERHRLERELDLARRIQQRLLPKAPPAVPGFDLAGWNRPADQTGGDCYDMHVLDDHRVALMIADATGHGIGPALIVSQCRSLMRATVDATDDLTRLAAKVNRLLSADLPTDRFVTTCYGLLDPAQSTLNYFSAGHGPLIFRRAATGDIQSLPATGLPMGILSDAEYPLADTVRFQPGDLFLMLTDGFTEWARPDGRQYGDERLIAFIARHTDLPCSKLIQALVDDVQRFAAGTPQADDLTAVLIKRTE